MYPYSSYKELLIVVEFRPKNINIKCFAHESQRVKGVKNKTQVFRCCFNVINKHAIWINGWKYYTKQNALRDVGLKMHVDYPEMSKCIAIKMRALAKKKIGVFKVN